MSTEIIRSRVIHSAMKRHELKKIAAGSKDAPQEIRTEHYLKLRNAEHELSQACETFAKSGAQP